ncbi:MAG: WS/DGAT domain-containing protein [Actinomycetota bacterium]|nr:WS/DGAT domain-containing protein [Actinomycetota bacterium]
MVERRLLALTVGVSFDDELPGGALHTDREGNRGGYRTSGQRWALGARPQPGSCLHVALVASGVKGIAPLAPLARNLDLSIGILSYDGEVSFGCYSDAEACPDLQLVAEGLQANLAALEALARESRASSS